MIRLTGEDAIDYAQLMGETPSAANDGNAYLDVPARIHLRFDGNLVDAFWHDEGDDQYAQDCAEQVAARLPDMVRQEYPDWDVTASVDWTVSGATIGHSLSYGPLDIDDNVILDHIEQIELGLMEEIASED